MLGSVILSLSLAVLAAAQIRYDFEHNSTTLIGVWSTGAGLVQTGPNFVDVKNRKFNPPATAGMSYTFTDTHFEMVEYHFVSNPSKPACPNATLLFQHGEYALNDDGSITLNPYTSDGLIQTQSPCSSRSSTIQQFNATITISSWRIWTDPKTNAPHLHLFRFDGAPFNKMILRSADPLTAMQPLETMIPIKPQPPRLARRNSAPSLHLGAAGAVLGVAAAVTIGMVSVML